MNKIITTATIVIITTITTTTSVNAWASNKYKREAAIQYVAASTRHAGNRSTWLPRVGLTKGDDYRNCINQQYFKGINYDFDSHDFCAWHAEIGKWQY